MGVPGVVCTIAGVGGPMISVAVPTPVLPARSVTV